MGNWRTFLARSDHGLARAVRACYRGTHDFSLPAPRLLVKPLLWAFLTVRAVYRFGMRVLVCEPLFKAACTRYGKGVHTDIYIHCIIGKGDILLGDHVLMDGKCVISFGARFTAHPTFRVGDHTGIGHLCRFTIGKRITIGRHCRLAGEVWMFDSPGHPADPEARQAGRPPVAEDVKPITIGDNVWIGRRALIFPGVTIGEGSIVAAGAVVMSDVPAYTMVAGNPARKIGVLKPPEPAAQPCQVNGVPVS